MHRHSRYSCLRGSRTCYNSFYSSASKHIKQVGHNVKTRLHESDFALAHTLQYADEAGQPAHSFQVFSAGTSKLQEKLHAILLASHHCKENKQGNCKERKEDCHACVSVFSFASVTQTSTVLSLIMLRPSLLSASVVSIAGLAEEALLLRWPQLALLAGDEQGALEGAAAACQAVPSSTAAWQQRLELQARHATLQVTTTSCSCSFCTQILCSYPS